LRAAKETAHDALRAVRESVGALRTARDPFVFVDAVSALVDRTRTDGCATAVRIEGSEALFDHETLTALYAVAQEGLTNVHKHAGATEVSIDVRFGEDEACLTIRDNGRGFRLDARDDADPGADGGYGLQSMCDRLTRVGGRLTIASTPGRGTTLTGFVPRAVGSAAASPGMGRGTV
jgi:signal transduction histidine kinase